MLSSALSQPLFNHHSRGARPNVPTVTCRRIGNYGSEGNELSIHIPLAIVSDAFAAGQHVDLVVTKENEKTIWIMLKAPPTRSLPRLRMRTLHRLTYQRVSYLALSVCDGLAVPHFTVHPRMRLEELEDKPGVKVLVIEIEDAVQELVTQSQDSVLQGKEADGSVVPDCGMKRDGSNDHAAGESPQA